MWTARAIALTVVSLLPLTSGAAPVCPEGQVWNTCATGSCQACDDCRGACVLADKPDAPTARIGFDHGVQVAVTFAATPSLLAAIKRWPSQSPDRYQGRDVLCSTERSDDNWVVCETTFNEKGVAHRPTQLLSQGAVAHPARFGSGQAKVRGTAKGAAIDVGFDAGTVLFFWTKFGKHLAQLHCEQDNGMGGVVGADCSFQLDDRGAVTK